MSTAFDRQAFEDVLKRRYFVCPSFEIYGGVAGLYDFGPPGCGMKANFLAEWRKHFVLEEKMLELDSTCLTPDVVLRTSGHVEKFQDMMVRDVETGDVFRADHLLEAKLEALIKEAADDAKKAELNVTLSNVPGYGMEELGAKLKEFAVVSPDTGNALSDPFPFNLMFGTQIGPTGNLPGFLRPETAQGIFVNFRRLLEFNNGKIPFAAAQIGQAFRNEIAPRSGLLRVREFTMAEIEHFVNEEDKSHPKFDRVKSTEALFLSRATQQEGKDAVPMTFGDAVGNGVINNETLGYFMARTQLFLLRCGVTPDRLRFRQHMGNEMAHYAQDCWDAEIHTSYGWIECVGHADRSCYDLQVHTEKSKTSLTVFESFDEPKEVDVVEPQVNKGVVGKAFRKNAKDVLSWFNELSMEDALSAQEKLDAEGSITATVCSGSYEITKDMVSFAKKKKKLTGRHIVPHVIEPSFGIGRILYAILEHAYYVREGDEQRAVLALSPVIAPIKVAVLPLMPKDNLLAKANEIVDLLTDSALANRFDDSGVAIGRKYARVDEIGVPFAVTIDYESLESNTVTLRERDSTQQLRVPIDSLTPWLRDLVSGKKTWDDAKAALPSVDSASN